MIGAKAPGPRGCWPLPQPWSWSGPGLVAIGPCHAVPPYGMPAVGRAAAGGRASRCSGRPWSWPRTPGRGARSVPRASVARPRSVHAAGGDCVTIGVPDAHVVSRSHRALRSKERGIPSTLHDISRDIGRQASCRAGHVSGTPERPPVRYLAGRALQVSAAASASPTGVRR
jgi:hypothetical protein